MKWKQIIIPSVVTLVVTIVSGLVVNWISTDFTNDSKKENLVYDIESVFKFNSDSTQLAVKRIRLINKGGKKANNLSININFGFNIKIVDKQAILLPSNEIINQTDSSKSSTNYQIKNFLPEEIFNLTLLLNNTNLDPIITIRSDESIAKLGKIYTEEGTDKKNIFRFLLVTIATAMTLLTIIFLFYRRSPYAIRKYMTYGTSLNNTAFMYIHKGKYADAERLLYKEINTIGGDSSNLSNMAVVAVLKGTTKNEVDILFEMAELHANGTKSNMAIIEFNKMIIELLTGNLPIAKLHLEKALNLDKYNIIKLIKFSNIVKEQRLKNTDFDQVVAQFWTEGND